MRRHSWVAIVLAILLSAGLLLVACQSAPAPSGPAKAEPPKAAEPAQPAEQPKTAAPSGAPKPVEQAKPVEQPKAAEPVKAAAKEPYKLGAVLTLSGPLAAVTTEAREAIQLEVEAINSAGGVGGHPLEVVFEDDGADPTRAATSLTKLIRQDKVLAVLGGQLSTLEGSMRPVTEREQVPHIVLNASGEESRSKNYKWSFNTAPSEFVTADGIVDILKDKGYKKIAAFVELTPWQQATLEALKTSASRQGIQVVVAPDAIGQKDVDVTPQVMKLKELAAKEKAQAVTAVLSASAPAYLKAAKQLGIELPVIGTPSYGSQAFLAVAGKDANGVVFPGSKLLASQSLPDDDPSKPLILDFERRFEAKWGKKPALSAGTADSIRILANALKVAGSDRARLREAIENTTNFVGVAGIYNYKSTDHEGLAKNIFAVYEVKDGKFAFVRSIK